MKLKNGIVTNSIDGESFAIATGEASKSFNGLIKNNPTAAYIFELLKTEQTLDSVVDALAEKYDAPKDVLKADAAEFIQQMDKLGILDK